MPDFGQYASLRAAWRFELLHMHAQAAKTTLQQQLEGKQHCLHKLQQMRTEITADNRALEKLLDTQKMAIDILQGRHQARWWSDCPLQWHQPACLIAICTTFSTAVNCCQLLT